MLNIRKWFAVLTIISAQCVVAMLGYWTFFDSEPPLKVTNPPVVINTPVAMGDPLIVRFQFESSRQCVGYMNSWVVGDYYVHLGEARIGTMPADKGQIEARVDLPTLAPGTYAFRAAVDYRCNPLRVITVNLPDAPFVMAPPGDSA